MGKSIDLNLEHKESKPLSFRPSNAFNESIELFYSKFGEDSHSRADICNEAMRAFRNKAFLFDSNKSKDGNDGINLLIRDAMKVTGDLTPSELNGLVVAWVNIVTKDKEDYKAPVIEFDDYGKNIFRVIFRNIYSFWGKVGLYKSGSCFKQAEKVLEESQEVCEAFNIYSRKTRSDSRKLALKKEIGDLFISLFNFCEILGFDLEECVNLSHKKNKDRDYYMKDVECLRDK